MCVRTSCSIRNAEHGRLYSMRLLIKRPARIEASAEEGLSDRARVLNYCTGTCSVFGLVRL